MEISRGNHGHVQRRRGRPREFTHERQKIFLKAFANSCNLEVSARECGISTSTIWLRRRDDEQFRAAFEIARDQAVANLQAELVCRGLALVRAATPEQAASAALPGMDAKFLLSLVQCHRANIGKDPGEARPGRSDPNEAAARLSALLLRMRMERKRELDQRRREQGR